MPKVWAQKRSITSGGSLVKLKMFAFLFRDLISSHEFSKKNNWKERNLARSIAYGKSATFFIIVLNLQVVIDRIYEKWEMRKFFFLFS
jgi:hypothetical protein